MSKQERNRPTKISLTACQACDACYEPLPGGRACPSCGGRTVTALVILPRAGATVEAASRLLLDTLARMSELAATR
jgi:hypothetical protein